jgi:hypothetical protein
MKSIGPPLDTGPTPWPTPNCPPCKPHIAASFHFRPSDYKPADDCPGRRCAPLGLIKWRNGCGPGRRAAHGLGRNRIGPGFSLGIGLSRNRSGIGVWVGFRNLQDNLKSKFFNFGIKIMGIFLYVVVLFIVIVFETGWLIAHFSYLLNKCVVFIFLNLFLVLNKWFL